MVLTEDGILDRTPLSGGSVFVRWEEIERIESGGPLIGGPWLHLTDPAEDEARAPWFRRLLMRFNGKFGPAPIGLVTLSLEATSRRAVIERLREHLARGSDRMLEGEELARLNPEDDGAVPDDPVAQGS